ncbi:hypothetical protein [Nocardioides panzhihuensis]|uniref:Uncharacterized protein n=1 Tax=Nocardioides panzhihuensis TaxID=860243 RepID=A0A7Z0DNE9_9ACTN|nr:hypothetical protein [Nocardioides panzhihuensis]NYI78713.1 hypothetical protein [Nocardioides panzhihuensis]
MAAVDPDDRADKALELHLAGLPYQRIAEVLDYANKGGAYKAVRRALTAGKPPPANPAPAGDDEDGDSDDRATEIEVELLRLDAMRAGLWSKARRGDVQAVDRVIRIGERQMELRALLRRHTPATPVTTPLSDFEERLRERQRYLGEGRSS